MANRITTLFEFKEKGSGLAKVKADVKSADGVIGKAKAGWKSAVGELARSPAAIGAAAAAMAAFAGKAIADASNLEESVNAINKSYGAAAEGVHALGDTSSESFGMSQRAFNEFAVQFSSFAKQIAREQGRDVVEVLEEMATRTADFASVQNLEMAEAGRVVMSTLAGETEAFRRYGGDVSAATVKNYALAEGVAESASELTESGKVVSRYGLFMEQTNNTSGDFQETQDGLANSTRTLSAQIEDLSARFGELLIPEMAEGVSTATDLLAVLDKIPGSADAFRGFAGVLTDFSTPIGWAKRGMDDLGSSWDDFSEGILGWGGEAEKELGTHMTAMDAVTDSIERAKEAEEERRDGFFQAGDDYVETTDKIADSIELAASNMRRFGDDGDEQMGRVEDAAEETKEGVDRVWLAFKRMNDDLSDEAAWLGIREGFASIRAEMEENGSVSERTTLRMKQDVLSYVEQLGTVPPETVSLINARIDDGDFARAEAMLATLARTRNAKISITPVKTGGAVFRDGSGNVIARAFARGTAHAPGGLALVGEQGPELVDMPSGARVHNANRTEAMLSRGATGAGGATVNVTVNAGLGADGHDIGRIVVDELEKFYRSGGQPPRSA